MCGYFTHSAHTPGNDTTTHCWSQSNGSHFNGPLSASPSQLPGMSQPKRRRHNAHSPTVNLAGYHPTTSSASSSGSSSGSSNGYSKWPSTMDTSMEIASPSNGGKSGMVTGRTPLKAHKVSILRLCGVSLVCIYS